MKKSTLMDAEVKKMEDKIKKYFLSKKTRMVRQGAYNHDDRVKAYCHKLINMMPWLGPHIANHRDQSSALQIIKCAMPTIIIKGVDSPRNMMNDRMELFMGGATT